MDFKLIKYYDTCCDLCGNWASSDIGTGSLQGNKKHAEKILIKYGWIVRDRKVVCNYCVEGKTRF